MQKGVYTEEGLAMKGIIFGAYILICNDNGLEAQIYNVAEFTLYG